MAYQANYLEEEEKKKAAENSGRPTSGVVDSMIQGGGAATGVAPEQKTPGTGFVNLQQYLDLNKGEGGRLAGEVTSDVSGRADSFGQNATNTVKSSQAEFDAATGAEKTGQLKQGLTQDASAVFDDAKACLGAGYAGPSAADKSAGIKADASALSDQLTGVKNADYQTQALQQRYGNNGKTYTEGFGLLDQFLVQGTDSGRKKIDEVAGKASTVTGAATAAEGQLKKAQEDAERKLGENKAAIVETAGATKGTMLSAAQQEAQALTQQNAGKIEGVDASLGDVLDQNEQLDLDALAELENAAQGGWYDKSFLAGKNAPLPPPPVEDVGFGDVPGAGEPTAVGNDKTPLGQFGADATGGAKSIRDTLRAVATDPFDIKKILAHDKALGPLGSIVKIPQPGQGVPTLNGLQKNLQKIAKGALNTSAEEALRNKDLIASTQKKIKEDLEGKRKQALETATKRAKMEAEGRAASAKKALEEASRIRSLEDARVAAQAEAQRQFDLAKSQAEESARFVAEQAQGARDRLRDEAQALERRVQDQAMNLMQKLPKIKAPKLKKFW